MFEKITEHIYVRPAEHYTDRPNIGLIVGSNYTLMFEAGNSAANVDKLKKELEQCGLPYPDFVAISHWHWDHSFGMHAWDAITIAGRETDVQLKKVSKWKWDDASMQERVEVGEDIVFCNEMIKREYPDRSEIHVTSADITFEGTMSIDLGGITCELIHVKGPHASDSVVCYVPEDKFLFLGDSNGKDLYVYPWKFDIAHEECFMEETAKIPYDQKRVKAYLELLEELEFESCIGGHAECMTREELFQMFL